METKRNAIFTIKGMQYAGNIPLELVTRGKYVRKNGAYYLFYREPTSVGQAAVATAIKAEPERKRVTVTRYGEQSTQMLFELHRRCTGLYETEYGPVAVNVAAQRIESSLGEGGGDLRMVYSMDVDGEMRGKSELVISVREELE